MDWINNELDSHENMIMEKMDQLAISSNNQDSKDKSIDSNNKEGKLNKSVKFKDYSSGFKD